MVAINALSTYVVTQIRTHVPSVSPKGAQCYTEIFPRVILMLPSSWYWVKWALVIVSIFLYDFRTSFVITSVFPFLRINSSHKPFEPLNTRSFIVISPLVSTNTGESPIINILPSLRTPYCVSRNRLLYTKASRRDRLQARHFPYRTRRPRPQRNCHLHCNHLRRHLPSQHVLFSQVHMFTL